jgi:hydrogenase expression/formation protein HypE
VAADPGPGLACPVPHPAGGVVQMAHGGGGRLMQRLLEKVIIPAFRNPALEQRHDSAILAFGHDNLAETNVGVRRRLAFTTDSFVVRPLFFPGGDIGSLAVNGTVNDLAMGGARPLWLSASFILEEGLPIESLQRIVDSMRKAADAAGVEIVTGDTKVVDRGKGDGIFINTAGIGVLEHEQTIGPRQVRPGDAILISGDIGRHGMAIMAVREGIRFETTLESDCAPISRAALKLLKENVEVHCLRDLTRGGLTSALVEIAEAAGVAMQIREDSVPVHDTVRAACELLGFDPLYVACEGRFVSFVPASQAERAVAVLRGDPLGVGAQVIGSVMDGEPGRVSIRNRLGTQRVLDMLSGEQLPRIC